MLRAGVLFAGGGNAEFTDENIAAGSVSVEMYTCKPKHYDFGTFNAAVLKIALIDDEALQHDFTGAVVGLSDIGESTEYLGTYYVDGTTVKRNRNTVSFSAYDKAVKFDIELPDNVRETEYTAQTVISAACAACGVSLSGSLPGGSPNTNVTFTLENLAVQTWRDAVMWACQLIGANAVIDRHGLLTLRKAWYIYDDTPALECGEDMRADVQFSDTRVYIKYLTSYSGKNVKTYTSEQSAPSQSQPGMLTLSKNPLLADKDESECDTINSALLEKPFTQRQIIAKLFSDSSISLGDLAEFSGGKIDVRRSIRGLVTAIKWKYHGYTQITCTAPDTIAEQG